MSTITTTSDALFVLRAETVADLNPGAIIRWADKMGDDADLADCEAAAAFLNLELVEDEDGNLVVA